MNSSEEARQIAQVRTRLQTKFPNMSREMVEASVEDAVARFAGSSIRDFVPLFVERMATARLSLLAESVPRCDDD